MRLMFALKREVIDVTQANRMELSAVEIHPG
jgi:hypothetical protein